MRKGRVLGFVLVQEKGNLKLRGLDEAGSCKKWCWLKGRDTYP
jgi:hypothetical protein